MPVGRLVGSFTHSPITAARKLIKIATMSAAGSTIRPKSVGLHFLLQPTIRAMGTSISYLVTVRPPGAYERSAAASVQVVSWYRAKIIPSPYLFRQLGRHDPSAILDAGELDLDPMTLNELENKNSRKITLEVNIDLEALPCCTRKMNCENEDLSLTSTNMEPRPASSLISCFQCRFCGRMFTYGKNARRHERMTCTNRPFLAMKHYDNRHMQLYIKEEWIMPINGFSPYTPSAVMATSLAPSISTSEADITCFFSSRTFISNRSILGKKDGGRMTSQHGGPWLHLRRSTPLAVNQLFPTIISMKKTSFMKTKRVHSSLYFATPGLTKHNLKTGIRPEQTRNITNRHEYDIMRANSLSHWLRKALGTGILSDWLLSRHELVLYWLVRRLANLQRQGAGNEVEMEQQRSAMKYPESTHRTGPLSTRGRGRVLARLRAFEPRLTGFGSGRGHHRIFTRGSRVGRCRSSVGFSRGSPVFPPLSFRRCAILILLHPKPNRSNRKGSGVEIKLIMRNGKEEGIIGPSYDAMAKTSKSSITLESLSFAYWLVRSSEAFVQNSSTPNCTTASCSRLAHSYEGRPQTTAIQSKRKEKRPRGGRGLSGRYLPFLVTIISLVRHWNLVQRSRSSREMCSSRSVGSPLQRPAVISDSTADRMCDCAMQAAVRGAPDALPRPNTPTATSPQPSLTCSLTNIISINYLHFDIIRHEITKHENPGVTRPGIEPVPLVTHTEASGATVAERLARSPPIKANRVQSPAGGNSAGRCCWSAGPLGDLPFPPSLHSGAFPYPLQSTFIGSRDLAVRSRLNLFTHSEASRTRSSSAEMKGRGKREIPEKIRQPTASSGTIAKIRTRITLVEGEQANRSATVAPNKVYIRGIAYCLIETQAEHGHYVDLVITVPYCLFHIPAQEPYHVCTRKYFTLTVFVSWYAVKLETLICSRGISLGGVVVVLLVFHPGEPGVFPGGVAPGFSHVGIFASRNFHSWEFLHVGIFACGNRDGRCRWSADFLGDVPFPPPPPTRPALASRCCSSNHLRSSQKRRGFTPMQPPMEKQRRLNGTEKFAVDQSLMMTGQTDRHLPAFQVWLGNALSVLGMLRRIHRSTNVMGTGIAAHANKITSQASKLLELRPPVCVWQPTRQLVAPPIENLLQHASANQTRGPFTALHAANGRTGTPTSEEPPRDFPRHRAGLFSSGPFPKTDPAFVPPQDDVIGAFRSEVKRRELGGSKQRVGSSAGMKGLGKLEIPEINSLTNSIFRHDSHIGKSGN
ncbi:hypothetical protein PR048_012044 [Dryococelus australis]|uniref:C2H2-type domain-containing protein n=1 Tax=Dryococelus australis TaxID=614101 RepID=A0ABQ9HNA3_9NEOP|nr:hypothetical protein PR048_012044 [Dryococelus australis]